MQVCGPLVNIGILTIRRPGRQLIQRETLTARKTRWGPFRHLRLRSGQKR